MTHVFVHGNRGGPGVGEQTIAAMVGRSPQERAGFIGARGISGEVANHVGVGIDAAMGQGSSRKAITSASVSLGISQAPALEPDPWEERRGGRVGAFVGKGGRAAECSGLENRRVNSPVGSNPTPSAMTG